MDFIKKFGQGVFAESEMNAFKEKIDYKTNGNHGLD